MWICRLYICEQIHPTSTVLHVFLNASEQNCSFRSTQWFLPPLLVTADLSLSFVKNQILAVRWGLSIADAKAIRRSAILGSIAMFAVANASWHLLLNICLYDQCTDYHTTLWEEHQHEPSKAFCSIFTGWNREAWHIWNIFSGKNLQFTTDHSLLISRPMQTVAENAKSLIALNFRNIHNYIYIVCVKLSSIFHF